MSKELNEDLLPAGEEKFSMRDIRSLAFHFVYAMEQTNYESPLKSIVKSFESGFDLEVPEDSYAITLARGVCDEREELDVEMTPYLENWTLDRLGLCTRLILRMGIWELKNKRAVPSIIINEAIELAKGFAEKDAYKFINGVLDQYVNKNVSD